METALPAFTILTVLLGLVAGGDMLHRLLVQLRGEREVVRRLAERPELRAWIDEETRSEGADRTVTEDDLDRMRPLVQQALRHLRDKERKPIEGALWQPSVRGRYNYLYKLLRASVRQLEHRHT